ncbi:COX15/CtaA family protein [Pseudoduganella namucuonensis]|uniref:Cytochrome c oxidase assembly protein subunit 15 n=1 Tax=Pseudoduganella namucuonensis TaxID=1035707 RepID=A0A1I7EWF4_9BURK|nr:COX15/CtaA family protein [Pseudoduganella namucuonensis]SFU28290.1 cytochrome c oxidase assembly protein subunit 15 [Pseudoduganella namucuonensis]
MHTTIAQLAITGLLVALLPLSMVWVSSDENKYRKLVWISVFLTFDLIVFGAFTRLTDSGLGCPDWPGCYGLANPFLAHEEIRAAEALMPTGPVTMFKAWVEMIHRYLAMAIGVLIMAMMATAWLQWTRHRRPGFEPAMPTALFFFVCLQGAFGAWTVTLKLQPVIVTIHLLLGMGLLAMLGWMGCRQDRVHAELQGVFVPASAPPPVLNAIRWLAVASAVAVLIQLALGGWVSTNYATLACTEFPLCAGKLVPEMDFEHGFHLWRELGKTAAGHYLPFEALTAIHWVHRNFALVVVALAGYTAHRAWGVAGLAGLARCAALLLAAQAATGVATIYLNFPLAIAVLHNGGAALLVLVLAMLNYRAKHQFDTAQQGADGSSRRPATTAPARHPQ